MKQQVFIFLAEGFEEIEAIAPIDILRRAKIPVTTVSISTQKEVAGAHGITIVADKLFDQTDFSSPLSLVLPGGLDGMLNLKNHKGLVTLLQKQHQADGDIAAICASPTILGELGILKGKSAICYPGFETHLQGATITEQLVVKDQHILTGKGPGAAIPFALKIVETLKGKIVADDIANALMLR